MPSYCFGNYFDYHFRWMFCSQGWQWGFTHARPFTKVVASTSGLSPLYPKGRDYFNKSPSHGALCDAWFQLHTPIFYHKRGMPNNILIITHLGKRGFHFKTKIRNAYLSNDWWGIPGYRCYGSIKEIFQSLKPFA